MVRDKTRLELLEELAGGLNGAAPRLRDALWLISNLDDLEEIKRIATATLRGELHGCEPKVETLDERYSHM